MKTKSLKLDDSFYKEILDLLIEIKKFRKLSINEAMHFDNRIQRKAFLTKLLEEESLLVREESLLVLDQFENLDS